MAKKKSNQQEKAARQNVQDHHHNQPHKDSPHPDSAPQPPAISPEDDSSAKLASLKSLNNMLVEETSKNREELNTLREANKSLESQLSLSTSEVESLRKEMEAVREMNEGLGREKSETERRVIELESLLEVSVNKMGELEKAKSGDITSLEKSVSELNEEIRMVRSELDRAVAEKDAVGRDLVSKVEEERKLERKLREVEAEAREKGEELMGLKLKCRKVEEENGERKRVIEIMKNEIELKDKCLAESTAGIEKMRREAELLRKEEMGLERQKAELSETVGELEMETQKLRQAVSALETGRAEMGVKLMDVKKVNADMMVKVSSLLKEVGIWKDGYVEKENEIEILKGEKTDVVWRMKELMRELEEAVRAKQLSQRQKDEIEEKKVQLECDIANLKMKSDTVNSALSDLQGRHGETVERNKKEVERCKELIETIRHEKEKAEKALREERANKMKLEEKLTELLKKMEDAARELKNSNDSKDRLSKEMEGMEMRYNKLVESKASVERELSSVQKQVTELKLGMDLKSDLMERALSLMRITTEQLTKGADVDSELKVVDYVDLEPFLAELEVIKAACMSRGSKVEEMKLKMDSMQECVTEARKNKSFWSLVSSATSVFAAAVLYAYLRK